ncbi:MAG: DUF3501 family protein [Nitrospirota bacterium]
MKGLTLDDVISYAEYERQRDEFRARIIALKRRRRIPVGDLVTLVFENRDTIQFQIQEMIRVEHIFDPRKIQAELDVYNALLPAGGQLSATLFIEVTEQEQIQPILDLFQGIDRGEKVAIAAGPHVVYGEFEGGRSKEEKISAVHFVRFRTTAEFVKALADERSPVTLTVHHGRYRAQAVVPPEMRQEWLEDLGLKAEATRGETGR